MRFIRWLAFLLAAPLLALQAADMGLKASEISLGGAPWILADRAASTYYMYCATRSEATTQEPTGVAMYKSSDLRTWEGPDIVFTVPGDGWADPSQGVWSPEVHVYRGKYYLLATLQNPDTIIDKPPNSWRVTRMRGTEIFFSESPEGPFERMPDSADGPIPPADFMTLDGTLYVEGAVPFMVYAHQWEQLIDGAMEAVELKPDLSKAIGKPFYLFKASDAPWLKDQYRASAAPRYYVAEGPQLYRAKSGKLLMLWSSFRDDLYVQTLAYSLSGRLRGPWRQMEPILGNDRGHGMIFERFDGTLMLVVRHPRHAPSRPELYEMEDAGDALLVKRRFPL